MTRPGARLLLVTVATLTLPLSVAPPLSAAATPAGATPAGATEAAAAEAEPEPSLTADPADLVAAHLDLAHLDAGGPIGPDDPDDPDDPDGPADGPLRVVAVQDTPDGPVVEVVETTGSAEAEAAVARLQRDASTLAVALDTRRSASDRRPTTPAALVTVPQTAPRTTAAPGAPSDDPYRPQLWGLGVLDAEAAWLGTRGEGVVVAVLDTGVDARHPDLVGRVLRGTDTVRDDPLPDRTGRSDPDGHGTHVAGVLVATAGNRTGVAGIAPRASVLPVRVLDTSGSGWDSDIAAGVLWAAGNGADVINLSLGGPQPSAVLAAAVAQAQAQDVLVVSVVGNARREGNPVQYPAAYPDVLGVGALRPGPVVAAYSGTGDHVDLTAPGSGVVSTVPGGGYAPMDGTSMAGPYVAGSAALLLAASGGTLTAVQLADALTSTATDLGPAGRDPTYGAGLVQPLAATCALELWCAPALTEVRPTLVVERSTGSTTAVTVGVRATDSLTGRPVAGLPVVVDVRRGGTGLSLTTLTTGADGLARTSVALQPGRSVRAQSGGTRYYRAADSPTVALDAPPRTAVLPGRGGGTLVVSPAAGQRLQVQRLSGRTWTTVQDRTATVTGPVLLTGLTAGSYRVLVAAVPGLAGTTTRTWAVR